MKIKMGKSPEKPDAKTPNTLRHIVDKLSTNKKRNVAHFLTSHSAHQTTTILNQIQSHSNRTLKVEVERQQCNGLLYANITRFR